MPYGWHCPTTTPCPRRAAAHTFQAKRSGQAAERLRQEWACLGGPGSETTRLLSPSGQTSTREATPG
eukprot:3838369-Alexandrium_andersonii.AAC.1